MTKWSFLTKHARVLVCIAHDPGVRLRDIATMLGITERSAYGIVDDLVTEGYVLKDKDGRRNRYQIQAHLPLREPIGREPTIGEVLEILVASDETEVGTGTALAGTEHGREGASEPSSSLLPADEADRLRSKCARAVELLDSYAAVHPANSQLRRFPSSTT